MRCVFPHTVFISCLQRDLLGIQRLLNSTEFNLNQLTALLDCRGLHKVRWLPWHERTSWLQSECLCRMRTYPETLEWKDKRCSWVLWNPPKLLSHNTPLCDYTRNRKGVITLTVRVTVRVCCVVELPGWSDGSVLWRGGGSPLPLPLLSAVGQCLLCHAVCHPPGMDPHHQQVGTGNTVSCLCVFNLPVTTSPTPYCIVGTRSTSISLHSH